MPESLVAIQVWCKHVPKMMPESLVAMQVWCKKRAQNDARIPCSHAGLVQKRAQNDAGIPCSHAGLVQKRAQCGAIRGGLAPQVRRLAFWERPPSKPPNPLPVQGSGGPPGGRGVNREGPCKDRP